MAAVLPIQYTVRPNEALKTLLSRRAGAQALGEAFVFSQRQPFPADHDYAGQTEDHETFAKLCYLAILEARFLSGEGGEDSCAPLLTELLGAPPRTVTTFDRWWSLERGEVWAAAGIDIVAQVERLPLRALRTVEGPRVRSARAEAAARELQQSSGNMNALLGEHWRDLLGSAAEDAVRRAREAASDMIDPVGAWWDALVAERANAERT